MNVWVFPLGILALVLALILRAPRASHPYRAALFFLIGLAASATIVRHLAKWTDVGRPTHFDYFIADAMRLAEAEPEAPIIVFSGASFSRNGLDDERLTRRLREHGYPHRVINLSLEGSSLQERHAALMRFLKRTKAEKSAVFLMVAPDFDFNSAYVFRVAKFSDRAIGQFTPQAAAWAAVGMAGGVCEDMKNCVKNTVLGPIHLGLNVLNVGLLAGGEDLSELSPERAYNPRNEIREGREAEVEPELVAERVLAEIHPEPRRGPHWASSFRTQQRADLEAVGVKTIAYYMPAVTPPDIREYIASICLGELADWPCIPPTDPALMTSLNGPVWFDIDHLQQPGAEHYTDWLANEIIRRGLLDGGRAE